MNYYESEDTIYCKDSYGGPVSFPGKPDLLQV